MRFQGFTGPSYVSRTVDADCQRTINFFMEPTESGLAKEGEQAILAPTPGLKLLATIGSGPIRGQWTTSGGRYFVVSGNELYEVDSAYTGTLLGTLLTSTGSVRLCDNGSSLYVVDGDNGYTFDLSSSVFEFVTAEGFLGSSLIDYIDGYFIFANPDSGQFYISGLNTTAIDPLDIASSEGSPDNIVSFIANNRELWIFNENTTEIFYNAGDAFPFQRVQGGFIEIGCAAIYSVAKSSNMVFWLGKDKNGQGVVYSAQGYVPQKISTLAMDREFQSYDDISDATSFFYQQDGHQFYVLNFPTANRSWAYDLVTGSWHERLYFNLGAFERYRAENHAFAFGLHIVGDYENGNIYQLDQEYRYEDVDGAKTIVRQRITSHVTGGLNRLYYHSIQIYIETGVGDGTEGQGSDPQLMLQFSDDSGRTWSNERTASIGKIGETAKRVIFRRLGASRSRVFKITVSDPVNVVILGAELNFEVGGS